MTTEREGLAGAIEALEQIALAGMSGTGQESEEGMRDWHARRAWEFIGIAARALEPARAAQTAPPQPRVEASAVLAELAECNACDPNRNRSNAGVWTTVNVPTGLWSRVLAAAKAQGGPAHG